MSRPRRAPIVKRATRIAADYSRFSTEYQSSIEDQKATNRELAEDHDIIIVASFDDAAVSRSLSDRPGIRALFEYIESHPEVGFIIINELERLTAGVAQRAEITRLCKRHNITIVTEDMGLIDPWDEDAMLKADERSIASAKEVARVSRRTKRSMRSKIRSGTMMAMRPPYGIRTKPLLGPDGQELTGGLRIVDAKGRSVANGGWERHPDEYPWLVQIFDWAAEGVSSEEIARRLTAAGVPTKSGKGQWRGSPTVNGILDNPIYKGEYTWGHTGQRRDEDGKKFLMVREDDERERHTLTVPSPLGPLVPVEQWEAIHEARAARRGERQMKRRTNEPQPLDPFVYCGRCGHRMYGRNDTSGKNKDPNKVYWRYYCVSKRVGVELKDGRPTCETFWSMSLRSIYAAMAGEVYRAQAARVTVREGSPVDDANARRVRIEAEIEKAEKRFEKCKLMVLDDLMTHDELKGHKAERDAAVADAERRLAMLESDEQPQPVAIDARLAASFAELAGILADEAIPVDERVGIAREFGLQRVYLDKPDLAFDLRT